MPCIALLIVVFDKIHICTVKYTQFGVLQSPSFLQNPMHNDLHSLKIHPYFDFDQDALLQFPVKLRPQAGLSSSTSRESNSSWGRDLTAGLSLFLQICYF